MEPTQHVVTAFRLPTTLLLNVDFYCLKNDATRSQFLRAAIRERLKALGVDPAKAPIEERNTVVFTGEPLP